MIFVILFLNDQHNNEVAVSYEYDYCIDVFLFVIQQVEKENIF